MSNRLLDLERDVRRARAQSLARQKSVRLAPGTRAFGGPVNYRVPGIVNPVRQPSGMTCWATVATIMTSWKRQQSIAIETVIGGIGSTWLAKFKANQGLAASEKEPFLRAGGFAWQYPQSLAPDGWERLLRSYGPLWVTTDEDPTSGFAIHARVMAGIRGDGTPTGTQVSLVDPANGREYDERFDVFVRKYEEEALTTSGPARIQIVHFDPAARASLGLGVGNASHHVQYDVPLIAQPNKLACWAAAMAMLVSYRRRPARVEAEALAQEVGRSLRTSYDWSMLEAVRNHFGFRALDLPSNASLYYSPEEWHGWLRTYGPLWVTTVGAPSHAIVVRGISGDLTPEGSTIHILNPWDTTKHFDGDAIDFNPANHGRAYSQKFSDFAADFGNVGLALPFGQWRVLHLPGN
jgi:hypothetical protein